ncbi:hypothetical protein K438DRAFT_2131634 [Mycena galopus ATCC 62051]|nr:hypothetical protein K438DRAFT_2131634 [Mycena galopus ATCC 62051]
MVRILLSLVSILCVRQTLAAPIRRVAPSNPSYGTFDGQVPSVPTTTTVAAVDSGAILASIAAAASAASTAAAAAQQSLINEAPPATSGSFTLTDPALIGEEAFLQTKIRLETEAGLDTSADESALTAFEESAGFGTTGIPGAATTTAPVVATTTVAAVDSGAIRASIAAAASAASTAAAAAQQSFINEAPPATSGSFTLTDPALIGEEAFLQTKIRLETEAGLDTSADENALTAFEESAGFGTTGIPGAATTTAPASSSTL